MTAIDKEMPIDLGLGWNSWKFHHRLHINTYIDYCYNQIKYLTYKIYKYSFEKKEKKVAASPRFEPGSFGFVGQRHNHYTKGTLMNWRQKIL